ncbi:hypothetical protein P153DRAFT_73488 [Dothidotthia symphoricarpi CBS 119687]|uniref:Uncharacterized protein n=1 Tax=Dothidotthia symphoricarpi CBS 119687 TaxID=1392245 RepID=A0A6A6A6V7_9PLEO|nr:uncharacterized protein P153DRAFT_73488 [Dothidotthia symphoricarpi CBS 119687]KAF2126935.1 hypothetical protein P153DRAFT_73488 [Dothidotthia symphoricarpi CBS 119687]
MRERQIKTFKSHVRICLSRVLVMTCSYLQTTILMTMNRSFSTILLQPLCVYRALHVSRLMLGTGVCCAEGRYVFMWCVCGFSLSVVNDQGAVSGSSVDGMATEDTRVLLCYCRWWKTTKPRL